MANSRLNPDAPTFVSSRFDTVFSPPLLTYDPNPNPLISYFPYPIYLEIHQTPFEISFVYACSPPAMAYQYFTYPSPSVPAFSRSLPRCSIEELDESRQGEKPSCSGKMATKEQRDGGLAHKKKVWVPKPARSLMHASRSKEPRQRPTVRVEHSSFEFSDSVDFRCESRSTLMIKNIPSKFSKGNLISLLDEHCKQENQKLVASDGDGAVPSEYDFLYVPIDFRTGSNFGYAFVNFTSPVAAWRLYKHLHNHSWSADGSNKVCKVNYARIQGLSDLIENADRMSFDSGIPDAFMPVHFEPPCNGVDESVEHLHGKRNISRI